MRVRTIEWPTLLLFAGAHALWAAGLHAGVTGWTSLGSAVLAGTVAAYAAFTPLHEATHLSVGRSALLNGVIGRVSGLLLMAPFVAVRHFHLLHHKHTNERERDPDHYSGRGPWWLLPFRWATQDFHYYWLFLRSYRAQKRGERIETIATFAVMLGLVALAFALGYGRIALLHWILPARVAIFFLAFAFDYVPHHPHVITSAQDRYRATRVLDSAILNVILCGQSYHLIHHLYPAIPFFRYRAVWKRQRVELERRGAGSLAPPPPAPAPTAVGLDAL